MNKWLVIGLVIIIFGIGYIMGMISCLLQVIRIEFREQKKIKEYLDGNKEK